MEGPPLHATVAVRSLLVVPAFVALNVRPFSTLSAPAHDQRQRIRQLYLELWSDAVARAQRALNLTKRTLRGMIARSPSRVLAAESLAAAATAFTGVHGHGWAMLSRNPCVT